MSGSRVGEELKRRVAERARGICEYCRSPRRYSVAPFSVDLAVGEVDRRL